MLLVLTTGLVGGVVIQVSPPKSSIAVSRVVAETSLVVPAGSRMLTNVAARISAQLARPGDTVYLRLTSALAVSGQVVIPAGSFVEATVRNVAEPVSASRLEIALRLRRVIGAQGDVADIFATGAHPSDSAYRRGVTAVADVPGQAVTMRSTVALVVDGPFTVDTRRSMASAFGRKVRVVGSPPRLECLVQSTAPTPDVRIPGTPATPAIGDSPGTPGTPDIVIPGAPSVVESWQPCR